MEKIFQFSSPTGEGLGHQGIEEGQQVQKGDGDIQPFKKNFFYGVDGERFAPHLVLL